MSKITKSNFTKKLTVLYDTREQENSHILKSAEEFGIKTERRKLDYGDYSFEHDGKNFSRLFVIERKASVDELYGNFIPNPARFEKEVYFAGNHAAHFAVLVEGVEGWDELAATVVPEWEMKKTSRKVRTIGAKVYQKLRSWSCGNRYGFQVEFVKRKDRSFARMLDIFYYCWRNYCIQSEPLKTAEDKND